jgi:hypothetical protein
MRHAYCQSGINLASYARDSRRKQADVCACKYRQQRSKLRARRERRTGGIAEEDGEYNDTRGRLAHDDPQED